MTKKRKNDIFNIAICYCGSEVEHHLGKVGVSGSSPPEG